MQLVRVICTSKIHVVPGITRGTPANLIQELTNETRSASTFQSDRSYLRRNSCVIPCMKMLWAGLEVPLITVPQPKSEFDAYRTDALTAKQTRTRRVLLTPFRTCSSSSRSPSPAYPAPHPPVSHSSSFPNRVPRIHHHHLRHPHRRPSCSRRYYRAEGHP